MTGEEEWRETSRIVQKVAAILEDRGDDSHVVTQRSLWKMRSARTGTLTALALLGAGGSLALATIVQHSTSQERAVRPFRVAPGAAERMPQAVTLARTTPSAHVEHESVGFVHEAHPAVKAAKHEAAVPQASYQMAVRAAEVGDDPDAPSPHLTGKALHDALIEDAAKTRALNLTELAAVDGLACRKHDRERC